MSANELLDELLSLFSEKIPNVVFCRAFSGRQGARQPKLPVVTGELESESVKPASSERRFCFRIFLPSGAGAHRAEEIFEQMCREYAFSFVEWESGKAYSGRGVHRAEEGESLWDYAYRFGRTVEELVEANPQIRDIACLACGEKVVVP